MNNVEKQAKATALAAGATLPHIEGLSDGEHKDIALTLTPFFQEAYEASTPTRRHLPHERPSITHKFRVEGHKGYVTVGLFDDGLPGELFIKMSKQGSTMSGMADSFATMTSLALQWGVPIKQLCKKFVGVRFVPQGHTGNPKIPEATSITDYIFRWLALKFLTEEERTEIGIKAV